MPEMTLERFNEHWRILKECEQGGAKPRVYRELIEEITRLRARIIEFQLRACSGACLLKLQVEELNV